MPARRAGSTRRAGVPAPNTTLCMQVSGLSHSEGGYRLLVRPQKAFDRYEPNDDLHNAAQITPGTLSDIPARQSNVVWYG